MKKIKFSGKLSLNKETITRLNNSQMNQIHGGTGGCVTNGDTDCASDQPDCDSVGIDCNSDAGHCDTLTIGGVSGLATCYGAPGPACGSLNTNHVGYLDCCT